MKTHSPRLNPKIIRYRCNKKFEPEKFLQDVKDNDFKTDLTDADLAYKNLSFTFRKILVKNAALKTKVLMGNTASFMNQHLQKAIYTRSRLKKIK